jgi:hypothetical protein
MIIKNKHAAAITWMLAVTMTSPSFAQGSTVHMSAARASAIHECNVRARKFSTLPVWGNWELYIYRACVAEHHQVE